MMQNQLGNVPFKIGFENVIGDSVEELLDEESEKAA
jgi:hypothetical protein